ncbi:tRNA 2-thiouridine(34) synthase MnmA [Candidatus Pacearchaeota archaeon CG_4_9_14_0_2_um_filter_39_13]|nr:tRNA 2-thiouridine(34) synthase MnmA [Candidatus Pacearchaeota archaeon]OIO43860.1 MAG: tRNA 2-thiouridine(34) synthase MnmA [Candidatus Pacearchaeota archaeon CG1_02_39_14]PJC44709.1 MAG: tRNA 2-thiouridine(34) synthase MnmA [Candidatus Pacearchaeota archaeon CG_4_9_14_0_2_um_filter_39_13]
MAGKKINKKKVVLGLSGGVDSAVAALLLKKQGYEVIGAFMKNFSDTKNKLTGECSWREEKRMAQKVASHLKIPLKVFDFEKEYRKYVINPMYNDYKRGLTPNPDALCNKVIKFPLFWKKAKRMGADCMAMGHYIKKKKSKQGFTLSLNKDAEKDQSYFLWQLTQEDLKHTLFPIGDYTKEQVREIARKNNLPNADKKGTVGICFVGKIDMIEFLVRKIKQKPGKIKDPEGNIIGKHNGIAYYTIGQRAPDNKYFQISAKYRNSQKEKIYIIEKDIRTNTLVVAPKGHPSSFRKSFRIINANFINPVKFPLKDIMIRIRHLGDFHKADIRKQGNRITCILKNPLSGIAPGQSAVIYHNSKMLGGGEIRL